MRLAKLPVLMVLALCSCVDDVTDEEVVTESAALTAPPGTHAETLIGAGEYWSYWDQGQPPDTKWRTEGCWVGTGCMLSGPAPLGYGESYIQTTMSYGSDANHKRPTTYFKASFFPPHDPIRKLVLRVMYDDGFVFYLNGHEGGRAAMPSGTITYNTLSSGHEAENKFVEYDITAQLPNLIAHNTNYLAFEVHQQTASSSDLVFDAELIAYIDGAVDDTTQEGIPATSTWHFWDQAAAVPAAWKTPAYDDSAWSSGQAALGFGETYLDTQTRSGGITTYFRKHFTRAGSVTGLSADVMYDDGFVAYLNGHEIARVAMPTGTITATTLSSGHEAAGYQHFDWSTAGMPWLVDGVNVLAVEVHQNAASSSDLVWDAKLTLGSPWKKQVSGVNALLVGVASTDPQHAWTIGGGGRILRTTDGGAHWAAQASGTTQDLYAIDFGDATHGWIVGNNGALLATTDGGASWHAQTSPVTNRIGDLDFINATTGWITGGEPWDGETHDDDGIYKTTDGGATWTRQRTGTHQPGNVAFATDGLHGYVSGYGEDDGFRMTATADGGATWTSSFEYVSPFNSLGFDLEVVDANTAWMVGAATPHDDGGEVKYVTHDAGATWTQAAETSNDMGVWSIEFIDAMHGWAVCAGGGIIATTDGGVTWKIQRPSRREEPADRPIGASPSFYDIVFIDSLHGWVVGNPDPADNQAAIFHTDNGGW